MGRPKKEVTEQKESFMSMWDDSGAEGSIHDDYMNPDFVLDMVPVAKISKDLKEAAKTLGKDEARFLVMMYYAVQQNRIITNSRIRQLEKTGQPHGMLDYFSAQYTQLEANAKKALFAYASEQPVCQWAMSIPGIGPVLAAGLLAHIDIEKAPTVGHIWSFAGIYGKQEWKKGQKRPWNAELKRLCYLIGQSFIKVSNKDNDVYGKLYKSWKEKEAPLNEAGVFADQAAEILAKKNFRDQTCVTYQAYAAGKLPAMHLSNRAARYATKIFLSHLHHVMYCLHYNQDPPKPYAIAHLGHAHFIPVPNFDTKTRKIILP